MKDRIPNPTKAYPIDLQAQMDATHPGQAHWAGTGPEGWSCRACAFFRDIKRDKSGFLKTGRCAKANGKVQFPHTARACKYFERITSAPPPIRVMPQGRYGE